MKRTVLSLALLALIGLPLTGYYLIRPQASSPEPSETLGFTTSMVQVTPTPFCSTYTFTVTGQNTTAPNGDLSFHACLGDAGQRFKFTITALETSGPHPGQTVTKTLYATVLGKCTFNTADTGTDWKVDLDDLSRVGFALGKPVFDSVVDVNGDGKVDILDMACVAFYYGQSQVPF